MNDRLHNAIISVGGTGRLPLASGTWGTLPAVALHAAVDYTLTGWYTTLALGIAVVALFIYGVKMGPWAERFYGRKDPGQYVIDEVAGYFVTVMWVRPLFPAMAWWQVALVGFFASRAVDTVKPFPARRLEKLPHGWGVLLDDLVAGAYASVILWTVLTWWQRLHG